MHSFRFKSRYYKHKEPGTIEPWDRAQTQNGQSFGRVDSHNNFSFNKTSVRIREKLTKELFPNIEKQ